MAWTAPRTWVTAEVVTAALMNTHLRDNLLETSTAKVTTAGDLTYASGANALARLGIGAVDQFLIGGASAPAWSTELGDATNSGIIKLKGPAPQLRLDDEGTTDSADEWFIGGADDDIRLTFFDDSAAANVDSLRLAPADFVLHTGDKGQGVGAVQVKTGIFSGPVNITTTGNIVVDITAVVTGNAAYVLGGWQAEVKRTDATASGLSIQPRNDAVALASHFSYGSANTGIADIVAAVDDTHTFGGTFFEQHTATDTSDYELFVSADDNNRFQVLRAQMHLLVIQYPA